MTTASERYREGAEAAQTALAKFQQQADETAHQRHLAQTPAAWSAPPQWPLRSGDSRQVDVRRQTLLIQLRDELPAGLLEKFRKAKADLRQAAAEARAIEEQRPPLTDSVDILADWRASQNERLRLARTRLETAHEIYDSTAVAVGAELERKRQAHVDDINRRGQAVADEFNRWYESWMAERARRAEAADEQIARLRTEREAWQDVASVARVENL